MVIPHMLSFTEFVNPRLPWHVFLLCNLTNYKLIKSSHSETLFNIHIYIKLRRALEHHVEVESVIVPYTVNNRCTLFGIGRSPSWAARL